MNRLVKRLISGLVVAGVLASGSLTAVTFGLMDDDVTIEIGAGFGWGAGMRVGERDRLVGSTPSGPPFFGSPGWGAFDNGNLNYNKGDLYSNNINATLQTEVFYKDFTFFMRTNGLYDFVIEHHTTRRTPLGKAAKGKSGHDLAIADLHLTYDFVVFDKDVSIRVGNQVINWGESTFISGGINQVNPFDIGKLRTPGSSLANALSPVPIVRLDVNLTDNLNFTGFWQWHWKETILDPEGTFFSDNDFFGPNGEWFHFGPTFGFVGISDHPGFMGGLVPGTFMRRGKDIDGHDLRNFGVSLSYYWEELNSTEFGLYFVWAAARLPQLSVIYGPGAPGTEGSGALLALLASGGATTDCTLFGPFACGQKFNYVANYPDDVKHIAASFNTLVGAVAVQGEYSFHWDVPVGGPLGVSDAFTVFLLGGAAYGPPPPSGVTVVDGYFRKTYHQAQITVTHSLGPTWMADDGVLLYEIAANVFPRPFAPTDDKVSFQYQIFGNLTFNNVFSSVNMVPRVSWAHTVFGTTPFPSPSPGFTKDAMELAVGFDWDYLQLEGGFTYAHTPKNGQKDRVTATCSYSF